MTTYRACSHGRAINLPEEIWIGVSDAEWPIRAFENADRAAEWVAEDPNNRHAYRVDGTITAEAEYVPPVPASHRIIEPPPARGSD